MLLIETNIKEKNTQELDSLFDTYEQKVKFFIKKFLDSQPFKRVLYVHTPYCKTKCKYCVYNSAACDNYEKIETFLNTIPDQIELFKEVFEHILFDQVYFGGGTPTILQAKDLAREFEMIPNFSKIPVKCLEASPSTINLDQLEVLKENRFSFISLGIQSLDPLICQKYNRAYISIDQLASLAQCLNDCSIAFNFDFIAYLDRGDLLDLKSLYKELELVIKECHPTYITVHKLYQSSQTCEKTKYLELTLKCLTEEYPDYSCTNSELCNENNYFINTMHNSEYRLMRYTADPSFSTYLWGQFPQMPVAQYNILSLGYTKRFATVSNADDIVLQGGKLLKISYDPIIEKHNKVGPLYK